MSEQLIQQTDSAKKSYSQSKEEGIISTINDMVFSHIKHVNQVSRNEIQKTLGLTARQTSCSVWHLIHQGKIKAFGTKIDIYTTREVQCLVVNDSPEIIFRKKSDKEKIKEIRELCSNTKAYQEILPYTTVSGLVDDIENILNQ